MPISLETYERLVLEDREGQWELVCGRPRRRPEMTVEHAHVQEALARMLHAQLDASRFILRVNAGRLRIASGSYYVPDICVIPHAIEARRLREAAGRVEIYEEPMPLVVEVWSPSTGAYDVEEKLRRYQERGDLEIWRIHPYEQTLTAWRRQDDGSYTETLYREGTVEPLALPGVAIDLARLFA